MLQSEEEWAETLGAFHAAALGLASWDSALRGFARATGSKRGQLIGFGPEGTLFNWITEACETTKTEFEEIDGHDPRVNSRVRVGSRAPEMQVLSEVDFDTDGDMRRSPAYGDFLRRHDMPFICLTTLVRRSGLLVGLAAPRGRRDGEIETAERRVFEQLAPHVRAAVLTQIALREHAAALVAGTLEAVAIPAFVCDFQGRVQAMTPGAESLVSADGRLKLREGRLGARNDADTRVLADMIRSAAFASLSTAPPPAGLVLRDASGDDPLLVEVAPLPGERHAFGFGVAALVLVRSSGPTDERVARTARLLFGFTAVESRVVAGLVAGRSPATVAEELGVSVGTVRTHVRTVPELIATVRRRL